MGATAAFQASASNADMLTYLLTGDAAATTTTPITSSGAATPDLVTDAESIPISGPILEVARAQIDGLGQTIVAGAAMTQAQARALFNSDGTLGTEKTPKLVLELIPRTGVAAWSVDMNVNGGNAPVVSVTTSAAAGTALLRVKVATPLR